MLVYTGRRDPVWNISECLNQDIPDLLLQARDFGHVYGPSCIPPKTGYKGILVHDCCTAEEELVVGPETVQLQLALLDTMPRHLALTGYHRQRVRNAIASGTVSADCPGRAGYVVPPYRPDRWNDNEIIRRNNNCYNYINALVTNTYAQPGRGSGQIFSQVTANAIRDAAVRDGLVVLNPQPALTDTVPAAPSGHSHLVALFIASGQRLVLSVPNPNFFIRQAEISMLI